jgi:hypothetical protein
MCVRVCVCASLSLCVCVSLCVSRRNGGWFVVRLCESVAYCLHWFTFIAMNRLVTLPAITSIAKSLGAKTVGSATLQYTREHKVIPFKGAQLLHELLVCQPLHSST